MFVFWNRFACDGSFVDGGFTDPRPLATSSEGGSSAPRIGFSEAGQEVAQLERITPNNSTGTHLGQTPHGHNLACFDCEHGTIRCGPQETDAASSPG